MPEVSDMDLIREYAERQAEPAFAELVRRNVNLVYSVALRCTGNAADAQDVAPAVFIILAQKAASLRHRSVLTGWLCETTRFVSARLLRTRLRRQTRDQKAHMQSPLNEPEPEGAWQQLAPHLETAMSRLGENDRTLLALRFYENKSVPAAAAALGIKEAAAHKRTRRALEKLRKFFTQRGLTLSAAALATELSTHSVHAAPAGLAQTISTVALAKGAAAGGSTLTLAKGALKVMVWTKAKTAIVLSVAALLVAGTASVVVEKAFVRVNSVLEQRLDDGSSLILNQVSYGDHHVFNHHGKKAGWDWPGHPQLVLELSLVSQYPTKHPLVNPAFYRQYRCLLRGEKGIAYAEEFTPWQFQADAGGYYGYVETSVFPHDSRWLWLRVEKRDDAQHYDTWQKVAEFKLPNPARSADFPWTARPAPTTNTVGDVSMVMGQVTVQTVPSYTNDIWNHIVTIPTQLSEDGALLTNWSPAYVQAQDASGNWISLVGHHRSLDPRFVWKLEMDFEPASNFPGEDLATVQLPLKKGASLSTNLLGVPLTFSWSQDGTWLDASTPTNQPGVALKLVGIHDGAGANLDGWSGSWNQYFFRKLVLPTTNQPVNVTIAVVPNLHTTFYVQPQLLPGQ